MAASPMPTLTAHVVAEGGLEFTAEVANLAPSSLFLRTARSLEFKQAVTVSFGDVTVHGEVAFVSGEPQGAVVVFRATPQAVALIEDRMEGIEVVSGRVDERGNWDDPTAFAQLRALADAPEDPADPDDPTNTDQGTVTVDASEDLPSANTYDLPPDQAAAEVREAFARSRSARLDAPDGDNTVAPVLDEEAMARARARTVVTSATDDETESGASLHEAPTAESSADGGFEESTEFSGGTV